MGVQPWGVHAPRQNNPEMEEDTTVCCKDWGAVDVPSCNLQPIGSLIPACLSFSNGYGSPFYFSCSWGSTRKERFANLGHLKLQGLLLGLVSTCHAGMTGWEVLTPNK